MTSSQTYILGAILVLDDPIRPNPAPQDLTRPAEPARLSYNAGCGRVEHPPGESRDTNTE
jgi:hypothetical protein